MGVGEVHPGPGDLDHDVLRSRLGIGQIDDLEHLGPAELLDLDGSHSAAESDASRPRAGYAAQRPREMRSRRSAPTLRILVSPPPAQWTTSRFTTRAEPRPK